jgi:hypothetical protein
MTDHDLIRWATSHTIHELRRRRDEEWHTGDEYDKITARIDRLERWHRYVKLDAEFGP